jgi:Ca2+-binding EF-hand superfamily protein
MDNGQLLQVFKKFDKDGNGLLTADEIMNTMKSLGIEISSQDVKELVKEMDENNDGKISYEEFLNAWNNNN